MKLYHGTSYKNFTSIIFNGIEPRQDRHNSVWDRFPSNPELVYLTTTYPFYFAISAIEDSEADMTCVVFEVDACLLHENFLYPDEDFIAQAIRQQEKRTLEQAQEEAHLLLPSNRHLWKDSLERLGNCCYYDTVYPITIDRACIVDFKQCPELALQVLNPSISVLNHHFCGDRYRKILKWFFDGGDFVKTQDHFFNEQMKQEAKVYWDKKLGNRDNYIHVVDFKDSICVSE